MKKEGGNFFEKHIEKLVIAIAVLVCIWILFTRAVFSPNRVEFDGSKLGPGEIDNRVIEKAKGLADSLSEKPKSRSAYDPCFPVFDKLVDSAIKDVNFSLHWPKPGMAPKEARIERKYRLPRVEEIEITDVECGNICTVAYVPIVKITEETTYTEQTSQPNDIDIVTVEGRFDISELYEIFYESFASDNIKPDWRDPCLASPVFAAVDLQRRQVRDDGSESQWQQIPRVKIDVYKEMFEIIENARDLPAGGIELRVLQFDDPEVVMGLLQPESYQIASADEEWFPPSLYKKYEKYSRDLEADERHRLLEEKRRKRESQLAERRSAAERGSREAGDSRNARTGGASRRTAPKERDRSRRTTTSRDRKSRERDRSTRRASEIDSMDDIYEQFDEILISGETDFSEMDELLAFWAHDDSVEQGKRYQYRIRLGIFNPIAGTNQFVREDEDKKETAILWTDFVETKVIEIPQRLVFFAGDIQETTNTVTVQVSRYVLGYWYSRDFMVRPGEVIGNVVEYEPADEFEKTLTVTPEVIDYSTGVVLVDVEPLNDWYLAGSSLRERYYFNMLYSVDGNEIEHMPIKSRYWSDDLQARFAEIKREEKTVKQPLRAWQSRGRSSGRRGGTGRTAPARRRPTR